MAGARSERTRDCAGVTSGRASALPAGGLEVEVRKREDQKKRRFSSAEGTQAQGAGELGAGGEDRLEGREGGRC